MGKCPNCKSENITKLYVVGVTFENSRTYCINCLKDKDKAEAIGFNADENIIGEEIDGK